jgi:hypothetical protein
MHVSYVSTKGETLVAFEEAAKQATFDRHHEVQGC